MLGRFESSSDSTHARATKMTGHPAPGGAVIARRAVSAPRRAWFHQATVPLAPANRCSGKRSRQTGLAALDVSHLAGRPEGDAPVVVVTLPAILIVSASPPVWRPETGNLNERQN